MYVCPFCCHKIKHFLPFGVESSLFKDLDIVGGGLRKCLCPVCHSTDRERLVYIYLYDYLEIFEDKELRILHIAPERNISGILQSNKKFHYVAGGLCADEYSFVNDYIEFDITATPFSNNSFDLIICNHVLEHVHDDVAALSEIHRLLSKDGSAIIQVPIARKLRKTREDISVISAQERLRNFGQSDHVRVYGLDYGMKLQRVGFSVKKMKLPKQYNRYGINRDEVIYTASLKKV